MCSSILQTTKSSKALQVSGLVGYTVNMVETTWYDIIGGILLLVLTSLIAVKMWSVTPADDEPKIILDEKQVQKQPEKVVGK